MDALEYRFYETALAEVLERRLIAAVLAKSIAECEGDERRSMARYIQLRVEQLRAEHLQSVELAHAQALAAAQTDQAIKQLVSEAASQFARTGSLGPPQLRLLLAAAQRDPSIPQLAERIRGNTLLHYCAAHGFEFAVTVLLASGADRTARNGDGKTPAQVASTEPIRAQLSSKSAA